MRSTTPIILCCLMYLVLATHQSKRKLSRSDPPHSRANNWNDEHDEVPDNRNDNDHQSPPQVTRRSEQLHFLATNPIHLDPEVPPGPAERLFNYLEIRINTGSLFVDSLLRAMLLICGFMYLLVEHLFNRLIRRSSN